MIVWVFGGTAVGKKRFIEHCLDARTRPQFIALINPLPIWINEGDLKEDMGHLSREHDLLVRWQWSREARLGEGIDSIVMLTCGLMAQLSRVASREGCLKWDAEALHEEMRSILRLVHKISKQHSSVPVMYVDSSRHDSYELLDIVA